MNKENMSAAGLRRSAIVERIRLREEWSELKGLESQPNTRQQKILTKKQTNIKTAACITSKATDIDRCRRPSARNRQQTETVLCGVVALVEVGSESRALPLRAALAALGATVLPSWSPLVTHLVWSQGGCRSTRARGRALASRLVSPLWVEACAAAARRLPEQAFPAAARASDLPSPKTLQRLLKKADLENIPIADLLSDSTEANRELRLRISSETEQDTSVDTDTSRDMSRDTSKDTSHDETIGSKTQEKSPRALPARPGDASSKSKRKLFTQKEVEERKTDNFDGCTPKPLVRKPSYVPPGKQRAKPPALRASRRQLARAERLAKQIVTGCTPAANRPRDKPRIVLTGMSCSERGVVSRAVRSLAGRVQRAADRRTTHVLLGSCVHSDQYTRTHAGLPTDDQTAINQKPRTLNALCGAARGCRVLRAQWALDSKAEGKWLHYLGYEVPHLKKISEKARLERSAWGKLGCEYGYDVFCGMRVRISPDEPQGDAAIQLLKLCGAVVQSDTETHSTQAHTQADGRKDPSQYYVTQRLDREYDVRVGRADGDVIARWVFDSVAAGRMRNTRRYLYTDPIAAELERLSC